jgi:hypothetical protein
MAPQVATGGGGLFVDHKKGEIPELKNLLRDSAVDKDPKAKRAIMERVVGYMTLGSSPQPLWQTRSAGRHRPGAAAWRSCVTL